MRWKGKGDLQPLGSFPKGKPVRKVQASMPARAVRPRRGRRLATQATDRYGFLQEIMIRPPAPFPGSSGIRGQNRGALAGGSSAGGKASAVAARGGLAILAAPFTPPLRGPS